MFVDKSGVELGRAEDKITVEASVVNPSELIDIDGVVSIEVMLEVSELIILVVCGIELSTSVEMEDTLVIKGEEDLSMTEIDNTGGRPFVLSVSTTDVTGVLKMSVLVSNSRNEEEYTDILDIGAVVVDIVSTGEDTVDIFKFRDVDELSLSTIEDITTEFINELFAVELGMLVVTNCSI